MISFISEQILIGFGQSVLWISTAIIAFVLALAVSRYGNIRLGGELETPAYGHLSWFSMLFAAGMGTGLVFHGAAEPLYHKANLPNFLLMQSTDAAFIEQQVMAITYLHWGFHAWAIYAVAALGIAFFAFNKQQPLIPSAATQHYFNFTSRHLSSKMINYLAILAAIFGLVASVSVGVMQIERGMNDQLSMIDDKTIWLECFILAALALCYGLSSITPLKRGIQWLSNFNIILCIALMIFVFSAGPTSLIIKNFIQSIIYYVTHIVPLGLQVEGMKTNPEWVRSWTITYLLWWIAWTPFVAVFIARISKGRTIRQVLLGALIAPTLFSALWFSIFGGAGFYFDDLHNTVLSRIATEDMSAVMFGLLNMLPFATITKLATILLIFMFIVTSVDSGAYVLAIFSSHGNEKPSIPTRLVWVGAITALVLAIIITNKGIEFTRNVALLGAYPYLVVILIQISIFCFSLKKLKP